MAETWSRNEKASKIGLSSVTEFNSTPSPNIHILLPSGIAVIGIDPWVERFTKIFQNVPRDQEGRSSPLIGFKPHLQPPNVISFQYSGGDL